MRRGLARVWVAAMAVAGAVAPVGTASAALAVAAPAAVAALAVAAPATMAAPAVAAPPAVVPPPQDESLRPTGSITFTWRGDPSRGCASAGLCGVQGALIISPQSGAATSFEGGSSILLEAASTTVRVLTNDGGALGECVDVPASGPGVNLALHRRNRRRLSATFNPTVSSGRCPGPIGQELARVRLPVKESAGKFPSFDLRTTRAFLAGPFRGEVASTLVLRPDRSSSSSSSGSFSSGPPPARGRLLERVALRYHVTLPGALEASFAGAADPFCGVLDSCGATGTIGLAAPGFSRTLTLTGSRRVAQPVSRQQALADLRRGRLRLEGAFSVPLVTSETLARTDGSRCKDSVVSRANLVLGTVLPGRRAGAGAFLSEADDSLDGLRTHCPGPAYSDVFGAHSFAFAQGRVGTAQLLRRRSTIGLGARGHFAGLGYVGSRGGEITVALSLERIHAGTAEAAR